MKRNKLKVFLSITSVLAFVGCLISVYGRKATTARAVPTEPTFVGDNPVGWDPWDSANKMDSVPGEPDVYVKTFSNLAAGQYSIVQFQSWTRYNVQGFDRDNSNASDFVYLRTDPNDSNIILLHGGAVEFKIYNPDSDPNSPAGSYRYTINYTMPITGSGPSAIIAAGNALDGWHTNIPGNRFVWQDLRYATLTRFFDSSQFKSFYWGCWEGDWGYSSIDTANSTAASVISATGGGTGGGNILLTTGGTYTYLFDRKTYTFQFHYNTSPKKVSKYDGTTKLETEYVYGNLTYNPTDTPVQGKKFLGWYTDSGFTTPYVPGQVSGDMNLYGRYISETRLTFYDKNLTLSSGDVYAYSWIPGPVGVGRNSLGGWPGTKMTNHGHGYHTLLVTADKIDNYIVFNNGQTGTGEVKTIDLVWDIPNNVYFHNESSWGAYSDDYHEATLFGITILNSTNNCDATGAVNNIAQTTWDLLDYQHSLLSAGVKSVLQNHEANVSGNLLYQAIARYDYIANKYGSDGFTNFINRTLPSSSPLKLVARKQDDYISVFVLGGIGLISFALFGYFNKLKKQRA